VPRGEAAERSRVVGELVHAAVHHVAGHGNQVGLKAVHFVDDRIHVVVLDGGAHVDVADLHDGEAFQRLGQLLDGHVDGHHARAAPRIDEADDRERHGKRDGERGRVGAPAREREHVRPDGVDGQQGGEQHVAQEGGDEQRREEAHCGKADPGEAVRERLALDHARQHAGRNQQAREHEVQPGEPLAGGRDGQVRNQPEADIHVQ
jgi:hypothetical protein